MGGKNWPPPPRFELCGMVMKSQWLALPPVTFLPFVQSSSSLFQKGCGSGWLTLVPGGTGHTRGSSGTMASRVSTGSLVGSLLTTTAMSRALTGFLTTRSLRKITLRCQLLSSGVEAFS